MSRTMTKTEKYEAVMKAGLVPFVKGRPGEAKSAIGRTIAENNDFLFIDLRLSTMEATDLGAYPVVTTIDGEHILLHAVPQWAHKAKNYKKYGKKGALILTEEINRCPQDVQNAGLGLMNERIIAGMVDYLVDPNIWIMATGNMGVEDGTSVDELDAAMNNRLVHFEHELTIPEWKQEYCDKYITLPEGKYEEGYKRKKVHPLIVNFLEVKSEYFRVGEVSTHDGDVTVNVEEAYPSARSWTSVSKQLYHFIDEQYDIMKEQEKRMKEEMSNHISEQDEEKLRRPKIKEITRDSYHVISNALEKLGEVCSGIVGSAASGAFIDWAEKKINEIKTITYKDILDGSKLGEIDNIPQDNKSEIIEAVKEIDFIKDMSMQEFENLSIFLGKITSDEAVSYIDHITASYVNKDPEELEELIPYEEIMMRHCGPLLEAFYGDLEEKNKKLEEEAKKAKEEAEKTTI